MEVEENPKECHRYSLLSIRSTRLWIGILLSAGFAAIYTMRTDLSLTMVCMVNGTAFEGEDKLPFLSMNEGACPSYDLDKQLRNAGYNGNLLWSPSGQSLLFSASVYGSILTGSFGGILADKFGPKRILLASALLGACMTLLTPIVAQWSFCAFFVIRFLIGCGEGFVFPALSAVASRWFVPEERSTMAALYTSGNQIGMSIISVVGAYLCSSSLGWEAVFYILGPTAILWYGVEKHKNACHSINTLCAEFTNTKIYNKSVQSSLPWRSFLTSMPVYATIAGVTANNVAAGILTALLPTFLKEYLRLPLSSNGLYTTLPFISQLISKNLLAMLADYLKRHKIISHTASVKIFQAINSIFCAFALIALILVPTCNSAYLAIPILVIFGIGNSAAISGYYTSILSLAPAYAGTICSISMTIGFIGNLCGLYIFGGLSIMAPEYKWSLFFIGMGIFHLMCGAFFIAFGSADIQPWAQTLPQVRKEMEGNEQKT